MTLDEMVERMKKTEADKVEAIAALLGVSLLDLLEAMGYDRVAIYGNQAAPVQPSKWTYGAGA